MKLAALVKDLGKLICDDCEDVEITHITHDSRRVQHGSIFVALKGTRMDGHDAIGAASQMGAVCVLTDTPEKVNCKIPMIVADEPRKIMARIARRLYNFPDRSLKVIGVTGTNGKTSFTYLVNYLLRPLGQAGRIGTVSIFNGVSEEKAAHTTPEASDVFRCLGEMVANQCRFASIEISSHGLAYDRVQGLELQYGIFTNLSQDHLDFHETMEDYFAAKQKQFDLLVSGGSAIINWDDEYGRRIVVPERAGVVRYGEHPDADVRFDNVELNINGSAFDVHYREETIRFSIPLLGRHNIYNYVAAMAVALREGRTLSDLSQGNEDIHPVPGRAELLKFGQDYGVMVDFAHTPDALENVLKASKETKPKNLIVVFGAGGDRDNSKRPLMGDIADRYADTIVLTSDNPRSEEPEAIMDMVQKGIKRPLGKGLLRDWDRARAIETALGLAESGDLVVIAGKGHETTQEIDGVHYPFSDGLVAGEIIRKQLEK